MINYACIIIDDSMTLEEIFEALDQPAPIIFDQRVGRIEYTVPDLIRLYNDRKKNKTSSVPRAGGKPKSIEIQDT